MSDFYIRLFHNKTENEKKSEDVLKPLYWCPSTAGCTVIDCCKGKRPPDFCRHKRQRTCFFNFVFFKENISRRNRAWLWICLPLLLLSGGKSTDFLCLNEQIFYQEERKRDLFHSVLCVCTTTSKWLQCYCALFMSWSGSYVGQSLLCIQYSVFIRIKLQAMHYQDYF